MTTTPRADIIFSPLPEGARPGGWWSVFFVLLIGVFGLIAAALAAAITIAVRIAADPEMVQILVDGDQFRMERAIMALVPSAMLAFLMTLFPALAAGAVFWTKVVENRPLTTIGFRGPAKLKRYLRGFAAGVVLAGALMALGGVVAMAFPVADVAMPTLDQLNWSALAAPGVAVLFAATFAFILIQGASEEILFRGWMLSSLGPAAGIVASTMVTSVMFGLFHGDRLLISLPVGLFVVLGTATVGVALARWALNEQGIFGVCGAHSGYNITLILGSFAALLVTGQARGVDDLFAVFQAAMAEDLASMTATAPLVIAQVVLFGALAVWLWPKRASFPSQP